MSIRLDVVVRSLIPLDFAKLAVGLPKGLKCHGHFLNQIFCFAVLPSERLLEGSPHLCRIVFPLFLSLTFLPLSRLLGFFLLSLSFVAALFISSTLNTAESAFFSVASTAHLKLGDLPKLRRSHKAFAFEQH